jgi:hypothetical protein
MAELSGDLERCTLSCECLVFARQKEWARHAARSPHRVSGPTRTLVAPPLVGPLAQGRDPQAEVKTKAALPNRLRAFMPRGYVAGQGQGSLGGTALLVQDVHDDLRHTGAATDGDGVQ